MCKNPSSFSKRTLPVAEALQGNLNTLRGAIASSDDELCNAVKKEMLSKLNNVENAILELAILISGMKVAGEMVDLIKESGIGIIILDDYVK